jgi:hypothetical protein
MVRTRQPVSPSNPPTEAEAATFDRLVPMLEAAHREMGELSKKKQDGLVNSLKIRNLNRLLTELRKLLEKDPSQGFVELIDEETLPQNSDVVLLLSQWQAALSQYKKRHYGWDVSIVKDRWFTVEHAGRPDR